EGRAGEAWLQGRQQDGRHEGLGAEGPAGRPRRRHSRRGDLSPGPRSLEWATTTAPPTGVVTASLTDGDVRSILLLMLGEPIRDRRAERREATKAAIPEAGWEPAGTE